MSVITDTIAQKQNENSQFYSGLFGSSLSDFWHRLTTGTISPEETQRIANQTGSDVARAGGSAKQVQDAKNEVTNFVQKFWPSSGNTAGVLLGVAGVVIFGVFVLGDSRRPRRRSRSANGGGSGVVAGLLAAGVAWWLWAQYLKSSHSIDTSSAALLPGQVSQSFGGPGTAETESGPIPLPNWIPLDVFNFGS